MDVFLNENQKKAHKLSEMTTRYEIMKRDDISGQQVSEKEIEQEIEKDIKEKGFTTMKKFRSSSCENNKGRALVEKFVFSKKMLEKITEKKEEEDEKRRILEAKITQMKNDQVKKGSYMIQKLTATIKPSLRTLAIVKISTMSCKRGSLTLALPKISLEIKW